MADGPADTLITSMGLGNEAPVDLWTLVLTFGLVARVSRFVTVDYLARWIRAYVIGKFGPDNDLAYGIACPWCFSMWAAIPIVLVGWFYGHTAGFQIVAMIALVSWLYGLVARNLDPIEDLNAIDDEVTR